MVVVMPVCVQEHPMVMSIYMTLVARVALQNQEYFWTLVNTCAQQANTQVRWWNKRHFSTLIRLLG